MNETKTEYTNGIAPGLMKAAMMLDRRIRRRAEQPTIRPKFDYFEGAPVLHAKRHLKVSQRERFEDAKRQIAVAESSDQVKAILTSISDIPIKSVPTKRAIRRDYSRFYREAA